MTEAAFTRMVLEFAVLHRWRALHLRPARTLRGWRTAISGSGVGFPDVLLLRGPFQVVAELKVGNAKATPEQLAWLRAFAAAGVPAYLWRWPHDWDAIQEVLG